MIISKWHYIALSIAGYLLLSVMMWELPFWKYMLALVGAGMWSFGNARASLMTFIEHIEETGRGGN